MQENILVLVVHLLVEVVLLVVEITQHISVVQTYMGFTQSSVIPVLVLTN